MGSEASTVSNMLRRLEQNHIIYRKQDKSDHRISNVYLTEKGIQLQGPIIWKEHRQKMLSGILPEELLLMRRITKAYGREFNK